MLWPIWGYRLATAEGPGSGFEGWRPLMENSCGGGDWEWLVHSASWASEWKENKQFPFTAMNSGTAAAKSRVDGTTLLWPEPHLSPWPAWHGHGTVYAWPPP